MFGKLKAKAEALINKANWTMDDLAAAAKLLLKSIMDGGAFSIHLEKNALVRLAKQILTGAEGPAPFKIVWDLTYSKLPNSPASFVGGPYGGTEEVPKMLPLSESMCSKTVLRLVDKDGDSKPEVYLWDGWVFNHQPPEENTVSVSA